MKKVKKILSLAAASLVMGGLIFSTPINTKTASAMVIRNPYNEKFRNENQIPIQGNYYQRILLKTRNPQMGHKPYWQGLIKVVNGSLHMDTWVDAERNYDMDDQYVFFVLNKDLNVRFKFLFSYNPKPQIKDEFKDFVHEFNKLNIGVGNYLIMVGKHWNGTALFDTTRPLTALKRTGHNNFEKGYSNNDRKYNTLLRVDHDGLREMNFKWGDERAFSW